MFSACHHFPVYYSSHVATSLRGKEAGENSQKSLLLHGNEK
jgi:hypothetical protein